MRLSYANVVATLALILSLGGVSYAAVTLPAHSVGARQLRDGAVGAGALGFPLGTTGVVDEAVEDVTRRTGACIANEPPAPGERLELCLQPAPPIPRGEEHKSTPGREVHVKLKAPGELLVSSVVGVHDEGAPGARARVTADVIFDGHWVGETEITSQGTETTQLPIQKLIAATPGEHTVGISVGVRYLTYGTGDVLVSPVSLIVSELPGT